MLNEKDRDSSNLHKDEPKVKLTELKPIQELTTLEFDESAGFFCDVNTGICGPVTQEKEEN